MSSTYPSPPAPSPPPRKRGGGRVTVLTAVLGLVAAVLSVIAGVAGALAILKPPPPPTPPGNQTTVVQVPPTTTDSEPSSRTYTTRSTGPINLVNGQGIDLDAVRGVSNGDSIQDIIINGSQLLFPRTTQILVLRSENPDYEACSDAKGYLDGDQVPWQYMWRLCLKTSEQRVAAITHIATVSGGITFDVIVYDPPLE
jgi:hypothetical protein